MAGSQAKQQPGSGDIGFNGRHRRLKDALDSDGGGEMVDDIALLDESVEELAFPAFKAALKEAALKEDALAVESEARVIRQMRNVLLRAGGEVVDDGDPVTGEQQGISKMRPIIGEAESADP